jgi:predicted DCC family thiol-disulfide oxidoreductase YuxK
VRLLLAEDRTGAFRFAPLGGPTFLARVPPARRDDLPDSLVLETRDGRILARARGAIEAGRGLGGGWRLLVSILDLLPDALLDRAYDVVAASRRRLFRQPADVCPVIPESLRGRFPDLTA